MGGRGSSAGSAGSRDRTSRKGSREAFEAKREERGGPQESAADAFARRKQQGLARGEALHAHAADFGWSVQRQSIKDVLGRQRAEIAIYLRGNERVVVKLSSRTGAVLSGEYAVSGHSDYDHVGGATKRKNEKVRWWLSGPRK